jgi:hypothetical protein
MTSRLFEPLLKPLWHDVFPRRSFAKVGASAKAAEYFQDAPPPLYEQKNVHTAQKNVHQTMLVF